MRTIFARVNYVKACIECRYALQGAFLGIQDTACPLRAAFRNNPFGSIYPLLSQRLQNSPIRERKNAQRLEYPVSRRYQKRSVVHHRGKRTHIYLFGRNAFISDVFNFRDVRNFFASLSVTSEIGRVFERVSFSLHLPRLGVPDDGDLNTTSTLFYLCAHI